ncbi:protein ANTAGONIST OF LIKE HETEROCHROMATIN PROTEIN 1 isoform X2 [Coregonus clupeaformis]|uniref:protein ANTAGONIST OF LIKE HETEROCHROMATIN PROTEIN 1 isoform X2 n=1 Tax=Coregonus clupeaformis TaxID=59861 RepID=UPI001BE12830|nr:protein ANTAGONIST OF LIKE HETEROCHROMATIN PROTEIN 1 isoform X2 [Coregonus clupeaformis]
MADEDKLRPLMFLMTYLLMKRRRDINNADTQRRNEMLTARDVRCSCDIRTRPWTSTECTDWWERVVMTEFQPSDWLEKFRMSRETFFFLCGKLKPRLARQDTHFRRALPLEKRVAVALWRLASNIEYRTISGLFGVGSSTVCKCVRDVCHAIVTLLRPVYLRSPSEQEVEDSARHFLSRWGFPHCVGAVATLHTAILTPSANVTNYANPDGWLSVVSQVAVNGLGQFWDVCAGFPGSTEPTAILQNSALWALASEGGLSPDPPPSFMGKPLRYVLLGEPGYPLQPWLMKAYSMKEEDDVEEEEGGLTESQRVFNQRFVRAWCVAEVALLRLRARWQCLSKRNDCSLDVVPTMILACCILHNVCEAHGDVLQGEWQGEVTQGENPQPGHTAARAPSPPGTSDHLQGEEVRQLYCDFFQQPQLQQQD